MNEQDLIFIQKRGESNWTKKQALKSAAYEVFSKKDTRRQEFQKLLDKLIWQSDLFYNYYESKEAIFLDIYIDENNRVRQNYDRRTGLGN